MLLSINAVEEDKFASNKNKNIKKFENESVKILAKLKNWNLFKFKSRNLF